MNTSRLLGEYTFSAILINFIILGPAKELSSNSFEISEKHPKIQEHINALNKKIGKNSL